MEAARKEKVAQRALTVIGICLCVILIPILIINVTIIIKGAVNPAEIPMCCGMAPLIVETGSMAGGEDDIRAGDLIFVTKIKPEKLKVGDVVTYFNSKGETITHRIIEIQTAADGARSFVIQGDANNTVDADSPVAADRIKAKYGGKIHGLGNFAKFLQKPVGMLCFVGIPLCIFILYDVFRRVKAGKKDESKTAELEAELERLRQESAAKGGENAADETAPEKGADITLDTIAEGEHTFASDILDGDSAVGNDDKALDTPTPMVVDMQADNKNFDEGNDDATKQGGAPPTA